MVMAREARIGATTFTNPSDQEIAATCEFDAPRNLVWEAHTRPEHASRWMLGPKGWRMAVCEIDLRRGGGWHFLWCGVDGSYMEMRGVFMEITPPERLVRTEAWGGDWPETLNTLVVTEEGGRTKIVNAVLYPSKQARENALGTGMQEGWSHSYDRLEEYLRTMA